MTTQIVTIDMGDDATRARVLNTKIQYHGREFVEALREMKDHELFQHLGYDTWGDYVSGELDFSRQHVHSLLIAHRVNQQLAVAGVDDLPTRSAYALSAYPEHMRLMIYQTVLSRYGKVTERRIRHVGDVIEEMTYTGHVDTGNGSSTPIDASLDKEQLEDALQVGAEIERRTKSTKIESIDHLHDGKPFVINLPDEHIDRQFRVIVYLMGVDD